MAGCPENQAPGRNVFASIDLFHTAHRGRRARLLREYVMGIGKLGPEVVQSLEADLRDLGISASQVLPGGGKGNDSDQQVALALQAEADEDADMMF